MQIQTDSHQYKDSRHLKSRAGLHARYANRNWFHWVADHLAWTLENSAPKNPGSNKQILDIGCGGGWFWANAASLLPSGLELTLTDTSQGMVSEAMKHVRTGKHYAEVDGQTADAVALPFPEQSFSMAVAMHMLYHVLTPAKAIAEMARVLKPHGLAAITTNNSENMRNLFELGAQAFGGPAEDPAASSFGPINAQAMLSKHFDTITVYVFEDTYAINDAEDIFLYLTSFPPGDQASDQEKSSLRLLIDNTLRQNNGILHTKRECALICGRKKKQKLFK